MSVGPKVDLQYGLFNQVRIQRFLEKTKKKTGKANGSECEEGDAKGQQMLRKRVTKLMKKQKLPQVQKILKQQDDLKPWGQDAHAKVLISPEIFGQTLLILLKAYDHDLQQFMFSYFTQVGSRLVELLIDTAYIQPPVDQQADGPPDIRPAFRHTLRTVAKEQQYEPLLSYSAFYFYLVQKFLIINISFLNRKNSRRYGVIECDPLVKQGLDRTVSRMAYYELNLLFANGTFL